ncbi:MAG TPA: FHA domain-containing protein [Thermoanaerobaculia bacterium]
MRIHFAEFIVDSMSRQLLRRGQPVAVSPKIFELLLSLIEVTPRALTKDELLRRVWTDTYVSDGTVAAAIAELREVLDDDAKQPRFVRTVHRYGYAFCAETHRLPETTALVSEPAYRLICGDREISLVAGENVLGRGPESIAWIDHSSVSRRHAAIVIRGDNATIEDLGSKNGTFVRGEKIRTRKQLADGDPLVLGRVAMIFRMFRQGEPTMSVDAT